MEELKEKKLEFLLIHHFKIQINKLGNKIPWFSGMA